MDAFRTECLYLRVLVESPVHKVDTYLRSVKRRERFHDNHVHQTVGHGGLRCNIRIVAVLACIGARNEISLILLGAGFVFHLVCLRLVFQSLPEHVLKICDRSALTRLGKFQRDESVKSHAASAEERQFVDDPIVESLNLAAVDDVDGFSWVERYAQMPCEPIARTTRNDTQRRWRMYNRAGHLVDGSVSTHSHYDVGTRLHTLFCYVCCMSRIFGKYNLVTELLLVESTVNKRGQLHLALCARVWV